MPELLPLPENRLAVECEKSHGHLRNTAHLTLGAVGLVLQKIRKQKALVTGTDSANRKVSGRALIVSRPSPEGFMKILLAVDGSLCSDRAVEEIGHRPWPPGSEIKVLTAFELPLPPIPEVWGAPQEYFEELDRAASSQARSIVERAVAKLRSAMGSETNIKGEPVPGPPRVVILEEARSWGADLIVVGSHGYRMLERFLLGSVSQSIVSHAKCSVEVVRCSPALAATQKPNKTKEEEQQLWPRW
jgi:nucleotide-binding universal stress UspA family protein